MTWLEHVQTLVEDLPAGTEFTTDLLWSKIDAKGAEPRMLGSVMTTLARKRLIAKTGEYRPTERPEAHSRPIPVWRRLPFYLDDIDALWAKYRSAMEVRFAAERAEAEALEQLRLATGEPSRSER